MQRFFHSKRFKILLGILAALMIGIIIAAASHGGASPSSSLLGAVFSPLQRLSAYVSEQIGNFSGGFVSAGTYAKEIDELKLGLHRVQVVFREPMTDEALHGLFNVVSVSRTGSLCTMVVRGDRARIEKKIASLEPQFCEFLSLSLEEVFIREMEAVGYDFEQIVC